MYEEIYPEVDGIVGIAHDIHCLNKQGFCNVMRHLKTDYTIKNCMKDEQHPHSGYFLSLKDSVYQRKVLCKLCNKLSTTLGCRRHGYKCENCGECLYMEYIKGATIRFGFSKDTRMLRHIILYIHSYDMEKEKLYCYTKPDFKNYMAMDHKHTYQLLEDMKDQYEVVTIEGKKLFAFHLPLRGNPGRCDVINVCDLRRPAKGGFCHYREVHVYKGEIVKELPVCNTYMVYETYKKSPYKHDKNLSREIIHAARQVASCDYYCQDGRDDFYEGTLERMRKFVKHFTDLPYDEFCHFLEVCRKDGPGFIVQLAFWVGEKIGVEQYVENKPNIWNMVTTVHKAFSGEPLTDGEVDSFKLGAEDEETRKEYLDIMGDLAVQSSYKKGKKGYW